MKTLLVGAGAMGTIIGALITEQGGDITIVDRYEDHIRELKEKGAKIVGKIEKQIPVKACLPDEVQGNFDLVLSITKHSSIKESLQNIKAHTTDDCVVLTLQNGFPEEKAKTIFSEQNIMGGSMEFSATFKSPGVTELASETSTLGLTLGNYLGGINGKVMEVKDALKGVGHIEVTDNIRGVKWTKITDNSCFSGLPTALGCEVGTVLDDDFALECAMHIGSECAQVIEAIDVRPVELFGLLPLTERLVFKNESEKQKVKKYWLQVETPFRKQVASMLQDIRKGRKCEIQEINGEISRVGELVGIKTPYNKKIVEIVTKLQNRELDLNRAWENLQEFKLLESS